MRHPWKAAVGLWVLLLCGLANSPDPLGAQDGALALSGFAGLSSDPGGFDVFRQSSFDAGMHYGGRLAMRLSPRVAVRGDIGFASNSGRESGAVNEDVTFDRTYYGFALEGRMPRGALAPYVFVGGGFVSLSRRAPSLTYEFTELAGRGGLGVSLAFAGTPLEAFGEVNQWVYARPTTGEGLQWDTSVNVGLSLIAF